jgi:serine/threonine protein phosphatase 1
LGNQQALREREVIKRFDENKKGRDFVVGDIHGCFTKLEIALYELGFDGEVDRLFSVGDLVDRGPESEEATEWLAKSWFHAVKGNHEDMAVQFAAKQIDSYMYSVNGGAWFIGMTEPERAPYLDAFKALPIAIEVMTPAGLVGIVHGECPVDDWALFGPALKSRHAEAIANMCLWSRERITNGYDGAIGGVRAVICGHTPLRSRVQLGNVHYIDTAAVFPGGKLTILDLATLEEPEMQITETVGSAQ